MKISFIIYTGMTALDFVGVYDPLIRLKTMGFIPDLEWDICAYTETVEGSGLRFTPDTVACSLADYDMVVVPGGLASRELVKDSDFIEWLKTAAPCRLKVSVCTGSLLLGAAGFLRGRRATTHPSAFGDLERYASEVLDQRVVDEGDLITARGVTSAIDLGLYLCEKLAGPEAKERIRRQMDYHDIA